MRRGRLRPDREDLQAGHGNLDFAQHLRQPHGARKRCGVAIEDELSGPSEARRARRSPAILDGGRACAAAPPKASELRGSHHQAERAKPGRRGEEKKRRFSADQRGSSPLPRNDRLRWIRVGNEIGRRRQQAERHAETHQLRSSGRQSTCGGGEPTSRRQFGASAYMLRRVYRAIMTPPAIPSSSTNVTTAPAGAARACGGDSTPGRVIVIATPQHIVRGQRAGEGPAGAPHNDLVLYAGVLADVRAARRRARLFDWIVDARQWRALLPAMVSLLPNAVVEKLSSWKCAGDELAHQFGVAVLCAYDLRYPPASGRFATGSSRATIDLVSAAAACRAAARACSPRDFRTRARRTPQTPSTRSRPPPMESVRRAPALARPGSDGRADAGLTGTEDARPAPGDRFRRIPIWPDRALDKRARASSPTVSTASPPPCPIGSSPKCAPASTCRACRPAFSAQPAQASA